VSQSPAEQEMRRLDREAAEYAASARRYLGLAMGGWFLAIVFGLLLVLR
jgi:hypothetical protein